MTASASPTSVDKAFALLRAFRPEDAAGLGVSELARRAGVNKSTTHRLLAILVRNGAILKADEVYRLGPLSIQMNPDSMSAEREIVSEILTPFLSALFEHTRHTVHLGHLVGTDVSYANKLFTFRGVEMPSRIGRRVPGYCTGVGKAMMAWDEGLIEASIARGLTPWTQHTITDPNDFRRTLACVRAEGIAYDREEIMDGLTCVAAPIFGEDQKPVAAFSVSGSTHDFTPRDHIPTLQKITHTASKVYVRTIRDSQFRLSREWETQ